MPTRLTQARRSQAKAGNLVNSVPTIPRTHPRCPVCGAAVTTGSTYCAKCVPAVNRENLLRQARLGRIATHTAIAEARRAANHAKQVEALRRWNPSDLPKWFDEDFYRREVLPRLSTFTVKKIRMRWTFLTPMRRSFGAEYASLILGLAAVGRAHGFQLLGRSYQASNHCNFAYSALACFRMGMSGTAALLAHVRSRGPSAFTHIAPPLPSVLNPNLR